MDPRAYMRVPFPPLERRTQGISSSTFKVPPLDGSLTIPELFDWQAEHSPHYPVYEYAEDDGSIVALKYTEVQQAIHRGAQLIQDVLSATASARKQRRPIVAIVSSSDTVTYSTMNFAVMRAALTVFPISPRNSATAVAHLLQKVQVDHVLIGHEPAMQELVASAFEILHKDVDILPSASAMPQFKDLYRESDPGWVPLPPMGTQDMTDIAMILHSSGSTAFPKPIGWSHYVLLGSGRWPHYHDRDMTGMRVSCHATPMYHGSGVSTTFWTVTAGAVLTVFKPQFPAIQPAPESTIRAATETSSNLLLCVPSMLEEWCKVPQQIEWIQRAKDVMFGGGPLAQGVGDLLASKGVNLFTNYGCTEFGLLNYILPTEGPGKDWAYFEFSPKCRTHFDPLGDGTYRLILVANEYQTPSVMNTTVDGVGAYDTNDIVSPHPTKEGSWKVVGRADEQIMHSTGEKTNPAPLEPMLNQDPRIQAAVMFGRGKFQPGVLIDPRPEYKFDPVDEEKLEAFRNLVWPTVEKVNAFAPQHSRIFKEMIIVSSPSKPFTYTAKNTARRPAIIDDYAPEIETLYKRVEETTQSYLPPPTSWTVVNTLDFIRFVVHHVMSDPVSDTADLFQTGCDSLQATWIRNSVLHALRQTTQVDTHSLPGNFVYQHPSITALAAFISSHAQSSGPKADESTLASRLAAMYAMLDKYGSDFPRHVATTAQPSANTVLVTGTTGSLGTALLAALVEDPSVHKVYAVNRKGGMPLEERQRQVLGQRGYDANGVLDSEKVVFVETNMDADGFGLSSGLYEEIRTSVTHIIHNAWPVDFNLSLSFFEPSVRGLRSLVDIAFASPFPSPPTLLFLSSIGVLRNVSRTTLIPEQPVEASVAVGMGYSESKWVCEQLLKRASDSVPAGDAPLRTIALRLGQITGSSGNGAWSPAEHLPAMLRSSQYIGCMPDLDAEVSWIPVDAAARAIFEMARSPGASFATYHLVHPRPVPWRTLFRPVAAELDVVPVWYRMWLWRLKNSQTWFAHATPEQEVEQMKLNPALKIIEFFERANPEKGASAGVQNDEHHDGGPVRTRADELREVDGGTEPLDGPYEAFGLPRLSVVEAMRVASSLREENLPQLTAEDAMKWLKYWRSTGFLRRE